MYKNFLVEYLPYGLSKIFLNKIYSGSNYINLLISPPPIQVFKQTNFDIKIKLKYYG